MRAADAAAALDVWHRAWLDAYARPGGTTRRRIEELWAKRPGAEELARAAERSRPGGDDAHLVAVLDGVVVGLAVARRGPGPQRLGALYVDAPQRGRGAGAGLMAALDSFFDPHRPVELGAAAFNDGAMRFYARHGFEEVPGAQGLHDGLIPEVMMRRPAGRAGARGANADAAAHLRALDRSRGATREDILDELRRSRR